MKVKRMVAVFACLLAVAFLLSGCTPEQGENGGPANTGEKIEWRWQSIHTEGTIYYQVMLEAFDHLKKATNGRFVIKPFPAGSIVGTMELAQACSDGVVDACFTGGGYLKGWNPAFPLFTTIPGSVLRYQDAKEWYYNEGGLDLLKETYKPFNIHMLQPFFSTEEAIIATKPLKTAADYKGFKARFVGLAAELIEALGGITVDIPAEEQYTALSTGLIEGLDPVGSITTVYSQGLYEVAKYMNLPGWHQPFTCIDFVCNMDKWNALPDEFKAILESEIFLASERLYLASVEADAEAYYELVDKGATFVVMPDEEVEKVNEIARDLIETKWKNINDLSKKIFESIDKYLEKTSGYNSVKTR